MENKYPLIHVGYTKLTPVPTYLFLRKIDSERYAWFKENKSGTEETTAIEAHGIAEAIRLANFQWKNAYFTLLNCGFRYTLPERDEHGINALFCQMAASYSTSNGVYFEEELGHLCFVQAASIEARRLWKKLKLAERL